MRTFKIIDRIKNAIEPAAEVNSNDEWEKLAKFLGYDPGEIGRNKLTSQTYYACMQIRCNMIAKLPLKLMHETGKGAEKAKTHPLYRLISTRPNPFTTLHDFLWATEFQRLEHGNAFWAMQYERGKISAFYLLDSTRMDIIVDNSCILDDKFAVYYRYNDTKKGVLLYRSDDIVHLKNFSKDGIVGTGVKKYLSDVIESEQYSLKMLKNRYKTGLQDPIVVTYTGDLNDAMQGKIKKKYESLGGAKHAGKVIPIPSEYDVKQLETKLVNSQFFQLQGLTTRQIANAFGVKGFQLNDMEKSTYNNIEQQNRAFYSDTLQNVLTVYEQELDYKTLHGEEQINYFWQFNVDAILRSDIESRYRAYGMAINSGVLMPSEAREKENLPFEEGTNQLILGNGASIPLAAVGKQFQVKGGESNEENI